MKHLIKQVIDQAAASFSASLDVFYPAHGRNGFNERNLSYQLAKAFESRVGAHAFMEVPFENAKTGRISYRIDCLLVDTQTVAFIECKRLYSPEKAQQLGDDFKRMNVENLEDIVKRIKCADGAERKVYRVMLTETWQKKTVDWWGARDTSRSWNNDWLPEQRGFVEVKAYQGFNTLYWLYAFEQLEIPE
ncbi:hypothetical protein [Pseudomonas canadensis]|uniref:hypothetical protein n=1 Tax=Pseudomonas canadensis TaxID=915099 RepID=UPI002733294D|nr:hypothetical protein [Pseudomonas canadensis]WLH27377.1 hypothetical protein PSH56_14985 [Pseudomonas canadensis]